MSNKVTVAAIQMTYGLEEACEKVREAASQGAQIILLPELFENWVLLPGKSYENYHLATTLEENPAVREMQTIARDFKVVIPVSYYERVGETTFNTVAVIDADGTIMGQYRKTHIPDDHFYQEKFYFTPGNTGFKGLGYGLCENRRRYLLGSVVPGVRSLHGAAGRRAAVLPDGHRLRADSRLRFHAALAALHAGSRGGKYYAADRCKPHRHRDRQSRPRDNQHQSSSLTFYGSSFIADETGALVEQADRENAGVLTHTFDLDEIREMRRSWGVYRDRRPEMYGAMRGYGE